MLGEGGWPMLGEQGRETSRKPAMLKPCCLSAAAPAMVKSHKPLPMWKCATCLAFPWYIMNQHIYMLPLYVSYCFLDTVLKSELELPACKRIQSDAAGKEKGSGHCFHPLSQPVVDLKLEFPVLGTSSDSVFFVHPVCFFLLRAN